MFAWDGMNIYIPEPQKGALEAAGRVQKFKKLLLPIAAVLVVGVILFFKGK